MVTTHAQHHKGKYLCSVLDLHFSVSLKFLDKPAISNPYLSYFFTVLSVFLIDCVVVLEPFGLDISKFYALLAC